MFSVGRLAKGLGADALAREGQADFSMGKELPGATGAVHARAMIAVCAESRVALIVGAEIGGLAAGVALQQAGWVVRILERAAHLRELGFALLLAPNAVVSLQQLGLAERVIAEGSEMTAGDVRGTAGRLLRRLDLARIRDLLPQPAVVVLRSALHGVLLDAVAPNSVSLNSEVQAASTEVDRHAVATLANGQRLEGDVFIGADGVGSIIRRLLHPHERPPRHSALSAVRGVASGVPPHLATLPGAQSSGVA